jgi:hypothetical protein
MIITGLVLLIAVGMVIWLGTQTSTKRTAPAAEQQRLRQVALQPVKDYIQSCLDVTTNTALELLGKQGGVLYRAQGGLTQDVQPSDIGSRHVVYDGLNVSYTILRPTQDIGTLFYAQPDKYPYPSFPYVFNGSAIAKTYYQGYYGKSLLPPLLKPGKESIQEQLESYINYNLPRCTDWTAFNATQGLSITAGKPNTTVLIAENRTQIETEQYFTVIARWQVNITDLTTGGSTVLDQFALSHPVHLAKFYLFVQGIVLGDINDATFDPRNASTYATPVTVTQAFVNQQDNGGDDIIAIQDTESVLRGKPLEFRALRKNRYPALVLINQTDLDDQHFIPLKLCGKTANQIFLEGKQLRISYSTGDPSTWQTALSAIDPDEDSVTYRTEPASPGQIGSNMTHAGQVFRLYVYASDGGTVEDYQILNLQTADCPVA